MTVKGIALIPLCLLALSPLAHAKDTAANLEFNAMGWVDVDANGRAHVDSIEKVDQLDRVKALAPIVGTIKARLAQRIESWQFVAATQDGVAVASRTYLRVKLQGTDDGNGGLAVRIVDASSGAAAIEMTPPRYPRRAYEAMAQGRVVLDVGYGENGRVASVEVRETSGTLDHPRDKASRTLVDASVEAARTWKFAPEQVAARPQPGHVLIPVTFCIGVGAGSCMPPTTPDADALPGDGDYLAIDPAVKLRSAVAGTAL